jgi:predicted lipoprotein with Yx(FWY)xxD motif
MVTVPEGLNAGDFGTVTREDGKQQTNYKGSPLYYFGGDKVPGDVQGQGVGNVWFVANP